MHPLSQLYPQLFWDIDLAKLDWEKHKLLIVERVIERGSLKAFQLTEQYYGKQMMGETTKSISFLNPRDMAFVNVYFEIPLSELKCYTKKQSIGNYLN